MEVEVEVEEMEEETRVEETQTPEIRPKRVPSEAVIEIPASLVDLLDSFVSSSQKTSYYFNQPPYVKVLSPKKYWRVYKENGRTCLELDATEWNGLICLSKEPIDTLDVLLRGPEAISMKMSLIEAVMTIFVSKYRPHKVRAINIYRKLMFYDELITQ
ncbi:MAG: hypothetical protein QXD36_06830 [Sulfolobales archaeon]